jgi:hypothetical protein
VLTHHDVETLVDDSIRHWDGVRLSLDQATEICLLQCSVTAALYRLDRLQDRIDAARDELAQAVAALTQWDPAPFP